MHKFYPFLAIIIFTACSGETESTDNVDFEESLNDLSEDILGPVWRVKSDSEFFELDIPVQMEVRDNLNPDASLQYSFLEKTDSAVHEHFIIVLKEPYPKGRNLSDSVDVVGFTEAYIDSLMRGRAFEVLNEPTVETIHQMEATIHELGSVIIGPNEEEIGIFYMLGVFKGQKGLYQVLTWTLMDQKDLFYGDMRHMMYSFKEIGEGKVGEQGDHDHAGHNH